MKVYITRKDYYKGTFCNTINLIMFGYLFKVHYLWR